MHRILVGLAGSLLLAWLPVAARAEEYDLEIITPHNNDIVVEFERAFSQYVSRPLRIRWIKKGTGQIIQQLDAQERAVKGGSFGIDVFFGGGVPDHDLAASKGYLESPSIPKEILAGIPKEIAGVANYDDRHLWFGAALSSFGVLMNRRGLASQNLPEIKEWKDLAEPRMYSWVAMADPRKSASVRVSYELILQQYGWEKGWPLLMQIAANSRLMTPSSADIPNEVATGDVLAGFCIDFYARARVAQAGADVLGYVDPVGGSAITPDPISMLRKPPHRELAEKFIAFVLSPEGQRLWVLPPGTPGGPVEHALCRLPVRPDVCQTYADRLLIKDPYKEVEAGTFRRMDDSLQRARSKLLSELMGAALVDQHDELREAWKALVDGGLKPAALAEWNKLPFNEKESLEKAKKLESGDRETRELTREWKRWFGAKYQRVKELAR
jgi:ABC-type Fe3+ transport system substrate-binding protein